MATTLQQQLLATEANGNRKGITAVVENITPAIAQIYLDTQRVNRTINKNRVKAYASQMRRGEWSVSNDAITFDIEGCLINGQHRLSALIEAGVTISMLVGRNYPLESQAIFDSGQARTVTQAMVIAGLGVGHVEAAVLRAMFLNADRPSDKYVGVLSKPQLIQLFPKYEESVRFASTKNGTRAIRYAPVRSLIARAHHCGADKDRLSRFVYVFDTGYSEGSTDFPAVALRSAYLALTRAHDQRAVFYLKSITALKSFLDYSTNKKLTLAKDIPWKIEELDDDRYFDK